MNPSYFQQNSKRDYTWDFQDPENFPSAGASQATDVFQSFDGLPRTNEDQYFMPASTPSMLNNYSPNPSSQASGSWNAPAVTSNLGDNGTGYSYNCSTNFSTNEQHASLKTFDNIPRTPWHSSYETQMINENIHMSLPVYDTIVATSGQNYLGNPASPGFDRSTGGRTEDCVMLDGINRPMDPTSPSSICSEDDGHSSREQTIMEDPEDHHDNADEPYAKLIFRALMSAPNHSMVLQEIYRWFRENTAKGSSDSKGWMNSIRHNLSMNAAFRKTERKIPGEETKKSTEWVLEPFAIKDGVQSTTRYRSKAGSSKKYAKLDNQGYSGKYNFNAIRKPVYPGGKARLQRSRVRDEVPKRMFPPLSRPEATRHSDSHCHISSMESPRKSPLTPNQEGSTAYSPIIKEENYSLPYEIYTFGDCQGVLDDEDSPLFMDEQESSQFMQY